MDIVKDELVSPLKSNIHKCSNNYNLQNTFEQDIMKHRFQQSTILIRPIYSYFKGSQSNNNTSINTNTIIHIIRK